MTVIIQLCVRGMWYCNCGRSSQYSDFGFSLCGGRYPRIYSKLFLCIIVKVSFPSFTIVIEEGTFD